MPFVKLDCGILRSTLWFDKPGRDVFIAALLMAEPREFQEAQRQLKIRSNEETGWEIPPGWYGFVPASGIGIAHAALVDVEQGLTALERFGEPEADSRSPEFEGRRLVRVPGGFIVLNYMRYRDRDSTAAERQRRLRERKRDARHRDGVTVTALQGCDITHSRVQSSEAEEEERSDSDMSASRTPKRAGAVGESDGFRAFYAAYPRKEKRPAAWAAWRKGSCDDVAEAVMAGLKRWSREYSTRPPDKIPHPATWLNNRQWEDEPPSSSRGGGGGKEDFPGLGNWEIQR